MKTDGMFFAIAKTLLKISGIEFEDDIDAMCRGLHKHRSYMFWYFLIYGDIVSDLCRVYWRLDLHQELILK